MKLKLLTIGNATVLEVLEAASVHDTQILKAGITKSLQHGRNQIIVHLKGAQFLDTTVKRELASLAILAEELSGNVLLVSPNESIREGIFQFSSPPRIPVFSSLEEAQEHLATQAADREESDIEAISSLPTTEPEDTAQEPPPKPQPIAPPSEELMKLKTENASLKQLISQLEERVLSNIVERRVPQDRDMYEEKILELENRIVDLSLTQAAKAKKN